jgi:cyclophilin family peptidyl-prolyl cis-trans isomerase
MQATAATVVTLFSILFPTKTWFSPDQAINVLVRAPEGQTIVLTLTDFTGKPIEAVGDAEVTGERTVDLRRLFQTIPMPNTYVLWAVPQGRPTQEFVGTPLVINVRADRRRDAPTGAMIVKIEPLCYARLTTDKGEATLAFYYEVAPHTIANFINLSRGGFYDGLHFHRIVPGFIIQGGDPRGDGTGGPGYSIDAEFSDRELREGSVAMARQVDPLEAQGAMPRYEFANSAGSQFFISLDYERTKQLDRRYTVFGRVTDGLEMLRSLANEAGVEEESDRPATTQPIRSIAIYPVEPGKNPYAAMMNVNMPRK